VADVLQNTFDRKELIGFSRKQFRNYDTRTVSNSELEESLTDGWTVAKKNKRSTRLSRPKKKPDLLESRVWALFYRMGFPVLSGEGGAELAITPSDSKSPRNQLDVVAVDDEIGLHVECKCREQPKRDPRFQEKLAKHATNRRGFGNRPVRRILDV